MEGAADETVCAPAAVAAESWREPVDAFLPHRAASMPVPNLTLLFQVPAPALVAGEAYALDAAPCLAAAKCSVLFRRWLPGNERRCGGFAPGRDAPALVSLVSGALGGIFPGGRR